MKKKMVIDDCLPRCEYCVFFTIQKNDDLGECHKNPPIPYVECDEVGYSFPVVPPEEWCGQFIRQTS